jgi:hypothetical protein
LDSGHWTLAQKKQGASGTIPTIVPTDNLAFVEINWSEVDRIRTEFIQRVVEERKRQGG